MATDVLYVAYGPQDESAAWLHDSIEATKSFGRNLGKVVVAGMLPQGLPADIVRFPVPPMIARGSRYDNAIDCIARVVESGIIGESFLYANPGAKLSAEVDLDAYPFLARRQRIKSVADLIRENRGGAVVTRYKYVLSDTRTALERNGYGAFETTGVFFSRMSATDLAEAKRVWLEEPHGEFGYEAGCLFGNILAKRAGITPEIAPTA